MEAAVEATVRPALEPVPVPVPEPVPVSAWAGEERLVREAILMVASHAAPRVLVAGIVFGDLILDTCKRAALEAGVRVIPRTTARENRLDIVVEAIR